MAALTKILICEDEHAQLYYLKSILEPLCDSVECVDSGSKAIEALSRAFEQKHFFSHVFLDIQIPDKTGHEVLEFLRAKEDQHNIPRAMRSRVVMLTAFGDLKNSAGAFSLDCDYYLVKPYTQKQINELLIKLGTKVDS